MISQRDTIQAASSFALRNHLPVRLQDQMLAHLCLKFRTDSEGLQQQETLESLPKAIRSSISHFLFYNLVDSVYLFRGVSNDLLFQLVRTVLLKNGFPLLAVTELTSKKRFFQGFGDESRVLSSQRRRDPSERSSYGFLHPRHRLRGRKINKPIIFSKKFSRPIFFPGYDRPQERE